jgi:hypothetical protein
MNTNKLSYIIIYLPDKSARILSYPIIESLPIFKDSIKGEIKKIEMSKIVNIEDPNLDKTFKDEIEIITDFFKDLPHVTINLKRNEKLVKQREKDFENFKK